MDRELLDKAKEIKEKLDKIDKVINVFNDKKFDEGKYFSLSVYIFGHPTPFFLPKEMTEDMLNVCYKYKELYEQQLEEL